MSLGNMDSGMGNVSETNNNSSGTSHEGTMEAKELPRNVQKVFDVVKIQKLDSYLCNPQMLETDSLVLNGVVTYNRPGVLGSDAYLRFDVVALINEVEPKFKEALTQAYEANKQKFDSLKPSEISYSYRPITIPEGYTGDLEEIPSKFGGGSLTRGDL